MHNPLSETPTDPPDEQLVSLAQGGDRRALEQLVGRHGPWIRMDNAKYTGVLVGAGLAPEQERLRNRIR
jgi:hypothetical protein